MSENRTTTCDHTDHTDLIDPTDYINTDAQMTVTSMRTPTRHHAYTQTAHAPMQARPRQQLAYTNARAHAPSFISPNIPADHG